MLVAIAACTDVDFDADERARLQSLTQLPPPPADLSNPFATDPRAVELGQELFFDRALGGAATMLDALDRPVSHARPGVSCASCHALGSGGSDHDSSPNHVSIGPGWTPTNAGTVINTAYYDLIFWNGRADSLWGMIPPVLESKQSMNGNRLAIAWRVKEKYANQYTAIFGALPFGETFQEATGHAVMGDPRLCATGAGDVCPSGCSVGTDMSCRPKFPLQGMPGPDKRCTVVTATTTVQPFNDAYDCMDETDRGAIDRVFVNVAKALAAYEMQLNVRDSTFEAHMRGEASMSAAAIRGARLFVGKAGCFECHNGAFFSDQSFHNIGVPQVGDGVPPIAGDLGEVVRVDAERTE